MTLHFRLPRLLGILGIACICVAPIAYAAELEGTPVPLGDSEPSKVQIEFPSSEDASAHSSERSHQSVESDQLDVVREQAERAREQADRARQQAEQGVPQIGPPNWEVNLKDVFDNKNDEEDGFNPAILIPLFAIMFIFGGPILLLIMLLVFLFGSKRRRQRDINMNIDKLLANGRDIPIELLRGDEPKAAVEIGDRDKGIRNIFLGAGWLAFLTVLVGFNIGAAGLIWIALGASQVLIWFLNNQGSAAKATDQQAGSQD